MNEDLLRKEGTEVDVTIDVAIGLLFTVISWLPGNTFSTRDNFRFLIFLLLSIKLTTLSRSLCVFNKI